MQRLFAATLVGAALIAGTPALAQALFDGVQP